MPTNELKIKPTEPVVSQAAVVDNRRIIGPGGEDITGTSVYAWVREQQPVEKT